MYRKLPEIKFRQIQMVPWLGMLPLQIEIGHNLEIPPENRTGQFCTSNNVEDETHFLFTCMNYTDERYRLIERVVIIKKWRMTPTDLIW